MVAYEDHKRADYFNNAKALANYFYWKDRGNFGRVKVVAEANLGRWNAWKKRPALLRKMEKTGETQALSLLKAISKG